MSDSNTRFFPRAPTKRELLDSIKKEEPHPENFVFWLDINSKEVALFEKCLNKADSEMDMQRFFEKHPIFLTQHLGGGHGRWCIPHQQFGCQFVPDFIIGEKSSIGYEWYGLELESPKAKLFNKSGTPSRQMAQAMKQINDWRGWIEDNIDYARRKVSENGLGLPAISNDLPSYIIIGRRDTIGNDNSKARRYLKNRSNIEIHTYDWILENSKNRIIE